MSKKTENDLREELRDLKNKMEQDLAAYYAENPDARKKLREKAEKIKRAEKNRKMLNIWEKY